MFLAVLACLGFSGLAPYLTAMSGKYVNRFLAVVPLAIFLYFCQFIGPVAAGQTFTEQHTWFPLLNININFYLDGLSLLFTLLISGMGCLIFIYAGGYLKHHAHLGRFNLKLMLFMAAMLGLVLADNLLTLFIFWELTSFSSFLLIGFEHERQHARYRALQGLLVTVTGGMCLLAGFILIGLKTNSYDMSALLQQGDLIRNQQGYSLILILICLGAFTKSAQWPFHFWLPGAMEAPTPVSAYLHSATMVKAGVYLLARFHPVLGGTELWFMLLSSIGAMTMLVGALNAIRQTDLKLLLAYTTIMALGSLVFLLGSSHELTIKAMTAFLLAHALYKGALFMVAGTIDHETGTRNINQLSGLRKLMPITFLVTVIAAASMAGLPPLIGFFSKELFYEGKLATPYLASALVTIAVFSNAILAVLSYKIVKQIFFGNKISLAIKEAPWTLWLGPLLLGTLTLAFGCFPFLMDQPLLAPAAGAVIGHALAINLEHWHGLTPAFGLSLGTLCLAALLYYFRFAIEGLMSKLAPYFSKGPAYGYGKILSGTTGFASWLTNRIQNGRLDHYIAITLSTFFFIICLTFIRYSLPNLNIPFPNVPWFKWLPVILCFISSFAVTFSRSYLSSIVLMGMQGICVALIFLMNSAPDVAMTQFLVETLVVIIVVLCLYKQRRLDKFKPINTSLHIFKIILSVAVGVIFSLILLEILQYPFNDTLANYYNAHSFPIGHGQNIVNVILVDFRAFDTLGEIVVVAAAAIGVYSLLRIKTRRAKN